VTDLKLEETIEETYTVDVNLEAQLAKVSSEKQKAEFVVGKPRSAMFFSVRTTKGVVPAVLSGKFTSLESGIKAVVDHVKNSKESFAVKSDRLHVERQKRKDAEPKPENG